MTKPYSREHQIASLAVLRASILTKQVQSTVSEISKEDQSPVTVADFAAQALLIGVLRDAFPNDSFLGEETAAALRADQSLCQKVFDLVLSAAEVVDPDSPGIILPKPKSVDEMLDLIDLGGCGVGGDQGRFWVMDPIDGTAAFLRGQQYAVSLSLIEDGREVVGVLGCPNISMEMARVSEDEVDKDGFGIMLTAVRGQGSSLRTMTLNGFKDAIHLNSFQPSKSNELHIVDCAACKISRHDCVAKLAEHFKSTFPNIEIWSFHIRYAALIVGGGNAQFWVPATSEAQLYIWDHAGTQLIFTELGGKVTDLDGKEMDFGAGRSLSRNRGLVVSRKEVHNSLVLAMNEIVGQQVWEKPGRSEVVV